MIKMIITDLDDTLLRSDKNISEHTIAVLKRCQSKGIKIVFATARSMQALQRIFGQFTPDIFIGYGGSLVLAGETVIRRFDIPAEIGSRLIKDCQATPEIMYIHAVNENVALTNQWKGLGGSDTSHYRYVDCLGDYDYAYLKISVNATSQAAVEAIAARYPMCDMLRYTGEDLYRFANRDAVKWNAVKAIAEYYHVGTDTFVAFGDDVNDVEMVEHCGIGVAVENAIEKVKNVADDICPSNNDDGVAAWLEEHVL